MAKISSTQGNHLDVLVLLRGIAVIIVCFGHFGDPLSRSHGAFTGFFQWFTDYGRYGVQIFFVISGFVIPLSLFKGKYAFNDYPRFLYKRVLRLHPPYLAGLALTLAIMFFSYRIRHVPFPETWLSVLKSTVYFHLPPDNPVFWTLAVEAQYYLFIGMFYVLLMRNSNLVVCICFPLLIFLGQSTAREYVMLLPYIIFFLIGIVGFLIYINIGNRIINYGALAAMIIVSAFIHDIPSFLAAGFAIALILMSKIHGSEILQFAGKISYSIYLIHFPIGIKIINFMAPRINPKYNMILFVSVMIVIFMISWIFYRVFEEYSERISRQIKYRAAYKKQSDVVVNHA